MTKNLEIIIQLIAQLVAITSFLCVRRGKFPTDKVWFHFLGLQLSFLK